jgi:glycosyltransferase involved in cell wall biosynthesis
MKISVLAPFPKYKDGIPRAIEELISKLCEADDVESVSVIAAKKEKDFVSPSLLRNKKVSLFVVRSFLVPWTLLRTIKLYKTSDVLILFGFPCYTFDPSSLLFFFQLLVKFGILPTAKWVQMLYDFVFYTCPEDQDVALKETTLYKVWKKYFVYIPVRYVAISESTKKEAMRYWGPGTAEITVIHLGSFVTPKSPRTHFGSKKILTVSDISPRKNQLRLIQAFELVHRANPSSNAELTIVGYLRKDIPEFESTLHDIRRRNKGINIKLAGYLADSEVLSLYEEADVFVYPSLYEGFGLPVLEAMACGCPVIASNVSSLPEVVGEAGLLVDPYDVKALAQAMLTVLEDDELKREMCRKGIAQAQKFSWEKAGAELLAVCREVAGGVSQPKGSN